MMKVKIGIFGSAVEEAEKTMTVAAELGKALAEQDVILITGACTGVPYQVVSAARKRKAVEVWGFSPARHWEEQVIQTPKDNNSIYTKLIYCPPDFPYIHDINVVRKYRNVIATATCDAGILVAGRWGTVNEFTCLYDMEKVIGVLSGSGGFADQLPDWKTKINKPNKALILFERSPKILVKKVVDAIAQRGGPHDIPEHL